MIGSQYVTLCPHNFENAKSKKLSSDPVDGLILQRIPGDFLGPTLDNFRNNH